MMLGSGQLGSAQLGTIGWFLLIVGDPHIILVVGAYLTIIMMTGVYRSTFDIIGDIDTE